MESAMCTRCQTPLISRQYDQLGRGHSGIRKESFTHSFVTDFAGFMLVLSVAFLTF